MKAGITWTTGKVLFLHFCGALLGGNLVLYLQAQEAGAATTAPLLGILLALLLPVLPVAHGYQLAKRNRTPAGVLPGGPAAGLFVAVVLGALLAVSGCAHLAPPSGTRAVEVARSNVCGAPGSETDRACSVQEHGRVRGGYRVVVDRRPPAGSDRVAVTLGRNGRIQVEPIDTVAQP